MTNISYDPSKREKLPTGERKIGYLTIGDGQAPVKEPNPPLEARDRKSLLNLLFWLVNTREGNDFLEAHVPPSTGSGTAIRESMRTEFINKFGILNVTLQDALIDGHFAATRWIQANKDMPSASAATAREENERVYQQKMSFVMWWLWEDAMGHDFSMLW